MTEQTDTSEDEGGGQGITVSRLIPANKITTRQIVQAARATLKGHAVRALNIAIVDDATITSLNQRYMCEAKPTDVLSFDLRDDYDDNTIEGEVVVSAEAAGRQAADWGVEVREEILRYVIHGTLHLMGYEDQSPADKRKMRLAEDRILGGLQLTDDQMEGSNKRRRIMGGG
ncbi:MAG: rRNA maturation RNase YbeY [Planctomycetota bacterium]|nr:MAG: rRNA maturation RNase YbeY [Planctomycetota bacterium]